MFDTEITNMYNEACEIKRHVRWKNLLVGIAAIASVMTISTHGIAFADPKHCDRPGWPSCYSVGFDNGQANPGSSCPNGHSANYCRGWEDGSGSNSNSGGRFVPDDSRNRGGNFDNGGQSHTSLVDKVCNFAQTDRALAAGAALLLGYPGLDVAVRALCSIR